MQGAVQLQDEDVNQVKRHWNSKIAKNYRDTMSTLRKAGKKPNWMGDNIWDSWVAWWSGDEFKVIYAL